MVNVHLKLLYPLTPTLLNDIIPYMLHNNISAMACIPIVKSYAMHYKNSGYTQPPCYTSTHQIITIYHA